mmetsp:Transcript_94556/g.276327  ORF Transcript_94556/g.276327 Transcript_94556/m.276327 type:complete len:208 (-) Transcript_94556:985-1608(-)
MLDCKLRVVSKTTKEGRPQSSGKQTCTATQALMQGLCGPIPCLVLSYAQKQCQHAVDALVALSGLPECGDEAVNLRKAQVHAALLRAYSQALPSEIVRDVPCSKELRQRQESICPQREALASHEVNHLVGGARVLDAKLQEGARQLRGHVLVEGVVQAQQSGLLTECSHCFLVRPPPEGCQRAPDACEPLSCEGDLLGGHSLEHQQQ